MIKVIPGGPLSLHMRFQISWETPETSQLPVCMAGKCQLLKSYYIFFVLNEISNFSHLLLDFIKEALFQPMVSNILSNDFTVTLKQSKSCKWSFCTVQPLSALHGIQQFMLLVTPAICYVMLENECLTWKAEWGTCHRSW